ncbi:IclR family transcriptional regulator [Rhodococcus sp. 15-1154-1]|nr:IclR family transcriptional regulator [Rhodococcus sp. 15-1154-1]OZE96708.1 IclR family transcriptional regulator [Rhodococcus sp. 15-1154-1]
MAAPAGNMRSLDRAFDVLTVLQSAKQPLRLSELARLADLHVATVQRILGVLMERGFAARSADGYTAGPAALAVAHAFMVTNPLSVLAQPILQQLAANTGFTASIYVRVEHSRVLIARVESDHPLSYVLPVGERLPLHLGGAGKTILAEMSGSEIDDAMAGVAEIAHADGSVLTKAEFRGQLEQIHQDGYAFSISERLFGIASVTAPVHAQDGTLAAVLGVTGPAESFGEGTRTKVVAEVRRAAAILGARVPTSR